MNTKKINILIFIDDSNTLYQWQAKTILMICALENCNSITLTYQTKNPEHLGHCKSLILGLIKKIDGIIYPASKEMTKIISVKRLISENTFGCIQSRPEKDLKQPHSFDLVINLSKKHISQKYALSHGKCYWQIHFNDFFPSLGNAMIDTYMKQQSIVKFSLWETSVKHVRLVSESTHSRESFSYNKDTNSIFWEISHSIAHSVQKLTDTRHRPSHSNVIESANIASNPTPSTQLLSDKSYRHIDIAWNYLKRFIALRLQLLFKHRQWILLIHPKSNHSTSITALKNSRPWKIMPSKDRFWADPFIISHENKDYLFFEELKFKTNKGTLAVAQITHTNEPLAPITILERPYHLSYPFVFQHQGTWYMTPETGENNSIELYKSTRFPFDWSLEKVLMKAQHRFYDPTLLHHENKWWLFVTIQTTDQHSPNNSLYLYFADSLTQDKWAPHPMNPISTDVNTARPAGKIFQQNGKLYRPSQNCSVTYGYGLNVMEITTLTTEVYNEILFESIQPWETGQQAIHTYNFNENYWVSDSIVTVPRFSFMQ